MVDETLLGIVGLDVPDGGFADQSDFHLLAVGPGEGSGANAAFPIVGILAEFDVAVAGIVESPQISGDGTLHGVADVVDIKRIAIGPTVQGADGIQVALEEGLTGVARPGLGGVAEGMLN